MIARLLLAAAVLGLAYDGGTYDLVARHVVAVVVWWAIAWLLALRIAPRVRLAGSGLAAASLLALFVSWTAISIAWATSTERAVLELDRALLYLGTFLLAFLITRREDLAVWCDGLALGLSATAGLALASRFFPGHFGHPAVVALLPGTEARLTYPVDYWNGLGILLALAVPLLLRAATSEPSPLVRGAALVPIPALGAALYLTSSRGGIATALVGTVVFLALTADRWQAAAAVVVAGAGTTCAIVVLRAREQLVDGPLGSAAAVSQGHSAAIWIGVACIATGAAFAALTRWLPIRLPAPAGWALATVVVALGIAAVVSAHPLRRFEQFKQPPSRYTQHNFVSAHLLSGRGNGRWQFWQAAVREFETKPLQGRGAGSWEAWWAQHRSISYFTRYAHSLYLQVLGELGIVGLLLLVGSFATALVGGIAAGLQAPAPEQAALAGAVGSFAGYAVGTGLDWVWQVPVVTIVAFVCLGLAAAFASASSPHRMPARSSQLQIGGTIAAIVVALAAVWIEGSPMMAETKVRASQSAVARGDEAGARNDARDAHTFAPWAATPYLQQALVQEQARALPKAQRAIDAATKRDPSDWRLWLVTARIATERGEARAAEAALTHVRQLDPRAPFLGNVGPPPR